MSENNRDKTPASSEDEGSFSSPNSSQPAAKEDASNLAGGTGSEPRPAGSLRSQHAPRIFTASSAALPTQSALQRLWKDHLGHSGWGGVGAIAGVASVVMGLYFGIKSLTSGEQSQNSTGKQVVGGTTQTSVLLQTKPAVGLSMRYSLPFSDAFPYGRMYAPDYPDGITSAPRTLEQMHTDVRAVHDKTKNLTYLQETVHGKITNTFIASYLIILDNRGTAQADFKQINLNVSSYKTEPHRAIWLWYRKGLLKPDEVEVSLRPVTGSRRIYPEDKSIIHLSSNETIPIRLNVKNAEPGVYGFHVEALGLSDGPDTNLSSRENILAMPSTEATTSDAIHIFADLEGDALAARINTLSDDQYRILTAAFLGRIPTSALVDAFLQRTFHVQVPRHPPDSIAAQGEKTLELLRETTTNGLEDIMKNEGAARALPFIRQFIAQYPLSDVVRYLEVLALTDLDDRELAKVRARELIDALPDSPLGHYGIWLLEHRSAALNEALGLDPENDIFLERGIQSCVIEQATADISKLQVCFRRLKEDKKCEIVTEVLKFDLIKEYGLALQPESAARLLEFDPIFGRALRRLPQFAFWKFAAAQENSPLSPIEENAVFQIMLHTGRMALAVRFAETRSRLDLLEKALCYARDFDNLRDHFFGRPEFEPVDGNSYIAAGLTLLHLHDRERFEALVAKYSHRFSIQTGFIEGTARLLDHQEIEGLRLILGSWERTRSQENREQVESNWFMRDYASVRAFMRVIDCTKPQNDKYDPTLGFWNMLYPDTSTLLTEWPIGMALERGDLGRQSTWVMLRVMDEVSNKLDVDSKRMDHHVVRFPLGTAFLLQDKVSDLYPGLGGLDLDECKRAIPDGEAYFAAGIYGAKLTAEQVQASRIYSTALFQYWNAGDLNAALTAVDDALSHDPRFYDALVLKAATLCSLNRRSECEKVGQILRTFANIPPPAFLQSSVGSSGSGGDR